MIILKGFCERGNMSLCRTVLSIIGGLAALIFYQQHSPMSGKIKNVLRLKII